MTDHFVEVPKKVLSPAAQAVLDAVFDHWPGGYNHPGKPRCVAAAIRALADQVVPAERHPPRRGMRPGGTGALSPDEGAEDQRAATRRKILAIATELDCIMTDHIVDINKKVQSSDAEVTQ